MKYLRKKSLTTTTDARYWRIKGLATVFKDIPVQVCHFHQLQTITRYLTRRPKTDAGKELRTLALTFTKTDEETFSRALTAWEKKWHHFYTEKTRILGTNRFYYTHKTGL